MVDPFVVALAALGLSVGVSAFKLLTWFVNGDPKAMAQSLRWIAVGVIILAAVFLVVLLFKEQWTAAAGLAAALLLVLGVYGPRFLRKWLKTPELSLDLSQPAPGRAGPAPSDNSAADPELVRRSIAVLEDYLHRSFAPARNDGTDLRRNDGNGQANGQVADLGTAMSEEEALEVLGLQPGAQESEINEAHRRMVRQVHPDHGGSSYLTIKVNQAKYTLLQAIKARSRATRSGAPRKSSRRRPPPA